MADTQVGNTQVGAEQNVPAANGVTNGVQEEVANLKDILGPIFGTDFKSDEDALKSVQEAKNMSGKVGQLEQQLQQARNASAGNPDALKQVEELSRIVKSNTFYAEHPEYNNVVVKEIISAMGSDPNTVVASSAFKTAYDAIQVRDSVEKSKSVVMSNPRLGAVTDKMSQARQSLEAGKTAEAQAGAVAAVVDLIKSES